MAVSSASHIKPRILVVEDTPLAVKVIDEVLQHLGCNTDIACTGEQALARTHERYDLILMDIGLPDMDGNQVAAALKESGGVVSEAPIVALTAHCEVDFTAHCAGKTLYFDKIINKPATVNSCQALLESYKLL